MLSLGPMDPCGSCLVLPVSSTLWGRESPLCSCHSGGPLLVTAKTLDCTVVYLAMQGRTLLDTSPSSANS